MKCIYCGFENQQTANTCQNCGKALQTTTASAGTLAALARELGTEPPQSPQSESFSGPTFFDPPTPPPNFGEFKPAPLPDFDEPDFAAPHKPKKHTKPPIPSLLRLRVPRERVDIEALSQPRLTPTEGVSSYEIGQQPDATYFEENLFVCPVCLKRKPVATSAIMPVGEYRQQRVCYECMGDLQARENNIHPAGLGNALWGLLSGILFGLICAILFAVASFMTKEVWLEFFFISGFLVGIGTRTGGDNRHGILLQLGAVLATLVTFVACLYGSLVGIEKFRFLDLQEFQQGWQNPGVLQTLDWVSLAVGVVIAFIVPRKPGAREID
jgi:hypothetical protein